MHPLVVAHFQAVHNVIQTGIHRYHFKNGAFDDKIALREEPENPSETIDTLQLLIPSPITFAGEKVEFRNILNFLVKLKETDGLGLQQSERTIQDFDLALDALREPFVEDHGKGSTCSQLGNN
jgi:hypothetical protein